MENMCFFFSWWMFLGFQLGVLADFYFNANLNVVWKLVFMEFWVEVGVLVYFTRWFKWLKQDKVVSKFEFIGSQMRFWLSNGFVWKLFSDKSTWRLINPKAMGYWMVKPLADVYAILLLDVLFKHGIMVIWNDMDTGMDQDLHHELGGWRSIQSPCGIWRFP